MTATTNFSQLGSVLERGTVRGNCRLQIGYKTPSRSTEVDGTPQPDVQVVDVGGMRLARNGPSTECMTAPASSANRLDIEHIAARIEQW